MSRDDTSLPTVWPTISPALFMTSVSSGSGTFQPLSARTRIGIVVADHAPAGAP